MDRAIIARFWPKVCKGADNDCWPWSAGTNGRQGYGLFWPHWRKPVLAHRFAYEVAVGLIPTDLEVLHTCDNRLCCNPAHLFLGTQADNMADMRAKGRAAAKDHVGARNPNARLTPDQVAAIRSASTGAYGEQSRLAHEYGVNPTTIRNIVQGRRWTSA